MPHTHRHRAYQPRLRRGMTLVEAILVVAIIAALMAILLPAMRMVRGQANLMSSQSRLRQIGALMAAYSSDNRGCIVPSRFDYSALASPPKVRSASPAGAPPNVGPLSVGTWSDILWTTQGFGPLPVSYDPADPPPSATWDYRYDSPDYWAYRGMENIEKNIFRSTVELQNPMSTSVPDQLPTPFGPGAGIREKGQPGYFAANDFFNSTAGDWFTTDMIKRPDQSLYLVDSRAGETIDPNPPAWLSNSATFEVEFRYIGGMTLMLFMDGHCNPESGWSDLATLQSERAIRVQKLDQN